MRSQPKLFVLTIIVLISCWGCTNLISPTTSYIPSDSEPKPVPKAIVSVADGIFETKNQSRADGPNSLIFKIAAGMRF